MEKLFVSYELAVLAKEKGFNEKCVGWFTEQGFLKIYDYQIKVSSYTKAPLYQQLVDWFRENHNMNIVINSTVAEGGFYFWFIRFTKLDACHTSTATKYKGVNWPKFNYYEALTEALKEAFKLI